MDPAAVDQCVAFAEAAGLGLRDHAVTWGARLDDAAERVDATLQWTLDRQLIRSTPSAGCGSRPRCRGGCDDQPRARRAPGRRRTGGPRARGAGT